MTGKLKAPFGSFPVFLSFMRNKDYRLTALNTINETKGRWYLNSYAYQMAKNADYSMLDSQSLTFWVGLGGAYEQEMEKCGKENLQFPKVGFNQKF